MKKKEILRILDHLINGVDPITRNQIINDKVWRHAEVRQALREIANNLRKELGEKAPPVTPRAGEPWADKEDGFLIRAYKAGKTIEEISVRHLRTSGAIRARLIKLGVYEPEEENLSFILTEKVRKWILLTIKSDTNKYEDRDAELVNEIYSNQMGMSPPLSKLDTIEARHWAEYIKGLILPEDCKYTERLVDLISGNIEPEDKNEAHMLEVLLENTLPSNIEESLALALFMGYRDSNFEVISLQEWLVKTAAIEEFKQAIQENDITYGTDDQWYESIRSTPEKEENQIFNTDWDNTFDDLDSEDWENYLGGPDDESRENS